MPPATSARKSTAATTLPTRSDAGATVLQLTCETVGQRFAPGRPEQPTCPPGPVRVRRHRQCRVRPSGSSPTAPDERDARSTVTPSTITSLIIARRRTAPVIGDERKICPRRHSHGQRVPVRRAVSPRRWPRCTAHAITTAPSSSTASAVSSRSASLSLQSSALQRGPTRRTARTMPPPGRPRTRHRRPTARSCRDLPEQEDCRPDRVPPPARHAVVVRGAGQFLAGDHPPRSRVTTSSKAGAVGHGHGGRVQTGVGVVAAAAAPQILDDLAGREARNAVDRSLPAPEMASTRRARTADFATYSPPGGVPWPGQPRLALSSCSRPFSFRLTLIHELSNLYRVTSGQ